jgi:signal transduction histidine kinase/CheY-like chemotaxis protein
MSQQPSGGIREALTGLTRRLDALAAGLERLATPSAPAAAGTVLSEAQRRALAPTEALLAVSAELERDTALGLAVDRVIHHALADCAAVFLRAPDGTLEAAAGRGLRADRPRVPPGDGIVGRAFAEGEIVLGGPQDQAVDALLRTHALGHAVAVPVCGPGGVSLGVLFAGRRRPAAFDAETLATLAILADRVAGVVGGGRPAADAGAALGLDLAELDLARATGAVAQAAAARLGAPRVAVLLPDGDALALAAGVGLPPGAEAPATTPEPLAGVLATGRPWSGDGDGEGSLTALLGAAPRLVWPLAVGERIVAVVVVGGAERVAADALADLAAPAALAIRNARLYTETRSALADLRRTERERREGPPPVRDLGSLLAVLLARVGLVRERVREPALVADLAVAEEAAWRAVEAVRAVLGFGPGRRGATLAPLDPGELLRAVVAEAESRWAARGEARPTVELDIEPLPPVRGQVDELAEALDAVLENAADAVPPGGRIRVRARWDGGRRVEVAVEDTGPGIPDEVRERALEPFFTTKAGGRLGLGLPVAQAILARHHGTLELTSHPGRGATVRLTLPTATGIRPAARPIEPARVLVIEDETPVRDALVELLRQHGHEVLGAIDGPEGIAVVTRESVDVVFTDLTVAQVSGFDVARSVKRLRPGTPVILITGWPGRLDPAAVEASGIDHVVEKPVGSTEVLAALAAALALRRGTAS